MQFVLNMIKNYMKFKIYAIKNFNMHESVDKTE